MSGAGKQKYSPDFKRNIAIEMSSSGVSVRDKARELGVGVSTLRRWMKDFAPAPAQQAEQQQGDQLNDQPEKGNGASDGCGEYSKQLLLSCYRAFDRCPDAIAIVGREKHLYCNNAYLDLFGFAGQADLANRPFTELVSRKHDSSVDNLLGRIADTPEGPCIEHEYECIRSDGEAFDTRIEFSRFPGEEDLVQVVLSRPDNSQHIDAFNSMVKKDYLTGMYSRQAFLEELRSTLADDSLDGSRTALLLIDLDKFGSVQNKVGYEKSDLIIRDIAGYLEETLPTARINARFDCHLFS
ncbi:diguanylate cyclase domain-containing protein, partial [Kaarinaea lacus]